jgi:hypothetical protein
MRNATAVMSILGTLLATAAPALAEEFSVERTAKLALARARRGVAIGPFVGAAPTYDVSGGGVEGMLVFGLAFSSFDVPIVPDSESIKAIVAEETKERLKDVVKQMALQGRAPSQDELDQLARDIYKAVLDEFLSEREPRLWEKPRFRLAVEGAKILGTGTWQTRATAGLGIKRFSLGPTLMLSAGEATDFYLGGELSAQLLPGKGVRSPIIDLFFRVDFGVTDGAGNFMTVGARLILDII